MACNDPIVGWKSKIRNETGKRSIVFSIKEGLADLPVSIPCGKCAGCRLARAGEWALRCTHEAQMHQANSFITLTYDDKNVPRANGLETLRPRDFVLFMKKLRKAKHGNIRFFQAGEYGTLGRPHHHSLLFNCDFDDKYFWARRYYGTVYRSETLEKIWSFGFCEIGEVNFQSAGYVARYTMKKLEGDTARTNRVPEYLTMSRRPGIGSAWYEKFKRDVYPRDEVIIRGGRQIRPPRFYDDRLEKENPKLRKQLGAARIRDTPEDIKSGVHRMAREKILRQRINEQLKRSL